MGSRGVLLFILSFLCQKALAAPPAWACGKECDYYSRCTTVCADQTCNAAQKNLGGDVLVLDTGSYGQQGGQGWNPSNPARCCEECQRTDGCNAWTYCGNKDGCGSGCRAYANKYKALFPVAYQANLPHLTFGNFKNCNEDKWPAYMCALKTLKDPKNPPAAPSGPSSGWVSGIVPKPITDPKCPPSLAPANCKACLASKDPAKCFTCATAAKRLTGSKDCALCANLATPAARDACITCATAPYGTSTAECLKCMTAPWEGKETQPLDVKKVGECFSCVAAAPGAAKNSCSRCFQSWQVDPKDQGACTSCVVKSKSGTQSEGCPSCLVKEVVGREQCFACVANAKSAVEAIGCGSCSNTNSVHPTFAKQCQTCLAIAPIVEGKRACYNLDSRQAKDPISSKYVTNYYACLANAKDSDSSHACWMCYDLAARNGGSGDGPKCYSCVAKVKFSDQKIFCSHCWGTRRIQSGEAPKCDSCLAALKPGQKGEACVPGLSGH